MDIEDFQELANARTSREFHSVLKTKEVAIPHAPMMMQLNLLLEQRESTKATRELIEVENSNHEEAKRMAQATEELARQTALMAKGTIALAFLTLCLFIATVVIAIV